MCAETGFQKATGAAGLRKLVKGTGRWMKRQRREITIFKYINKDRNLYQLLISSTFNIQMRQTIKKYENMKHAIVMIMTITTTRSYAFLWRTPNYFTHLEQNQYLRGF